MYIGNIWQHIYVCFISSLSYTFTCFSLGLSDCEGSADYFFTLLVLHSGVLHSIIYLTWNIGMLNFIIDQEQESFVINIDLSDKACENYTFYFK